MNKKQRCLTLINLFILFAQIDNLDLPSSHHTCNLSSQQIIILIFSSDNSRNAIDILNESLNITLVIIIIIIYTSHILIGYLDHLILMLITRKRVTLNVSLTKHSDDSISNLSPLMVLFDHHEIINASLTVCRTHSVHISQIPM